jgi:hypothetical protein
MRADIVDRVDLAVASHDRDRRGPDHHAEGAAVLDVVDAAGADEFGH